MVCRSLVLTLAIPTYVYLDRIYRSIFQFNMQLFIEVLSYHEQADIATLNNEAAALMAPFGQGE